MKTPMLSAHFSFNELTDSDRFPGLVEKNRFEAACFTGKLRLLCLKILEPIREQFGPVKVDSGYRCPALNKADKGSENSQHLKAEAADIVVPGQDLDQVFAWIKTSGIEFGQLIREPGWIHVSLGEPYRPEEKCGQVLRSTDGKTYTPA